MGNPADVVILAIDLGTSGPKVALISRDGRILASDRESTPVELLPGGGAEQRPDDWWRAIVVATRRMLEHTDVPRSAIRGVCCTAQWSGTVAVGEDGAPLGNAVIWMDSRGARYLPPIVGGMVQIDGYGLMAAWRWLRLTGGIPALSGKDPIAHILFLRHERPEIYEKTRCFLEPKDYLNYKLTGQLAASFESITLHWVTDNRDLKDVRYSPALLARAGLSEAQLPPLLRAVDVLGPLSAEAAAELGLSTEVQVVMGTPDLHSAAIGSGAVRDYEAHLYIGTSSWITAHLPFKKTDLKVMMATIPSAIPERYLVGNTQESAGACIDHLIDKVFFAPGELASGGDREKAHALLEAEAARAEPGSGKLIFSPWLYGERTPVEDATIRGGFFNLSLSAGRPEMVRAVYEGVAYNGRWLLEALGRFMGREVEQLAFIGGGASSPLWAQIHADVMGVPIRCAKEPRLANALGAGLLGAVGLGELDFETIPDVVERGPVFEPDTAHRALYDQLYGTFREIYRQHRPLCARLNGQEKKK